MTQLILDRVYRREYGRVVSVLVARLGLAHVELIEDATQEAWVSALATWPLRGVPSNPAAWLFRAAHNAALDRLRSAQRRARLLASLPDPADIEPAHPRLAGEVDDAQLRMLLACCDPALGLDAQRALALRILFGLSVAELAVHLFTTEANIYKRLQRSRRQLRAARIDDPAQADLGSARSILHLLFTEGYASHRSETSIREDLCDEAIRLTTLLAERDDAPPTAALLALMHMHRARLPGRIDGAGGLLLLPEQDRSTWSPSSIAEGMRWLARSAQGNTFSRYHAEAGIAAEHCRASSFEQTRWDRIVRCYALLERTAPSALHRLGHALAIAQVQGPRAGLAHLRTVAPPSWLEGSFPFFAVLADLHHRSGHERDARRLARLALEAAPTPAVRSVLRRRLAAAIP